MKGGLDSFAETWYDAHQAILKGIVHTLSIPVGLGSGHRTLTDKVACEVYKRHLEKMSEASLADQTRTFYHLCGDMGIESGVPDYHVGELAALLPPWMSETQLGADIDDGDTADAVMSPSPLMPDIQGSDVEEHVARAHSPPGARPDVEDPQPPSSGQYLPNGTYVYGVQHMFDNLLEDAHAAMPDWDDFYTQLKNIESMLRVPERRQRFLWTLGGTRYEHRQASMKHWSHSLYEKRWREVCNFVKRFQPVRKWMTAAWSESRYVRGVDNTGSLRVEQARVQAQREDQQNISSFSPSFLTTALQSPRFHLFFEMVLLTESVPPDLAQEAEICPCHYALVAGMSKYMRHKVFEKLYGRNVKRCPLSGVGLAEFVGSDRFPKKLEELFKTKWDVLYTIELPHSVNLPSDADWKVVTNNFQKGIAAMKDIYYVKTNYMFKAPVLFAGLAQTNQVWARRVGSQLREDFEREPSEQLQHRRTWSLLKPGAEFGRGLDVFNADADRKSLGTCFRKNVARERFRVFAETSIERKHAWVTLMKGKRRMGPVRISLANRMQMLEEWLQRGIVSFADLLDCFMKEKETFPVSGNARRRASS